MKTKNIMLLLLFSFSFVVAQGQSIDSFLQLAFDQNPTLKALELDYEAAMQKAPQVGQLEAPTIGLAVPILRTETRLGGQVLAVSASQMFPWFGTLKAKKEVVISMAKERYEKIALIRSEVIFQIKNAYYNLYWLEEQQKIINESLRIYNSLERVALAKVESGKATLADALRLRIKIEGLQNKTAILEQKKELFYAAINVATNRYPTSKVTIVDSLVPPLLADYNLEVYKEKIANFYPLIKQLDWKIKTSQKEQQLNILAGKPSIGIGLDYSLVSPRSDAFPLYNGRDILIPKVKISVPIYRKKYKAKEKEEQLKQEAILWQKEALQNKILAQIVAYKVAFDSNKLKYDLSVKQSEIAKTAFEILLAEYSSKGNRFDELIQLKNNMLLYELMGINALAETFFAKLNIDRLTDF